MKICPRCQKTYTDDNLNFCLEDGSVLTQGPVQPPQTVQVNQPQVTGQTPPAAPSSQPGGQPAWNTAQPQYSMQPAKKSSKTWIWVVLIFGVLILVCGGGFVGFLAYVGSQAEKANLTNGTNSRPSNSFSSGNRTTTSTNSSSSGDRSNVDKINLADMVSNQDVYGHTEFNDGVLIMSSLTKRYYMVRLGDKDQTTESANTKVTVRNMDAGDSTLGYGLVFHSNPTPLQQGYAFLIDSKTRKYRVVHHEPQKELTVVAWTKNDAIKAGDAENTLEVRDLADKIELYINGTMVKSITNTYGYPGGIVGLYASDAIRIGFKDLEIHR